MIFVTIFFSTLLAFTLVWSLISLNSLKQSNFEQIKANNISNQIRLSTDRLTQAARAYVITGDEKHLAFYHKIVDIREGLLPRPKHYHRVYWGVMLAENTPPPFPLSDNQSLKQLLENEHFSTQEKHKLLSFYEKSKKLSAIEQRAFKLVTPNKHMLTKESRFDSTSLLFNEAYSKYKAEIYSDINDFYQLQEQRTSIKLAEEGTNQQNLIIASILCFLCLSLSFLVLLMKLQNENREKVATLNKEVREKTQDIRVKNQALEDSLEKTRAAQRRVVEAEKQSALASLVCNVAHEINTPLGVIITATSHVEHYLQALTSGVSQKRISKRKLNDICDNLDHGVDIVLKNSERISSLVQKLKTISGDNLFEELQSFHLIDCINNAVEVSKELNQQNNVQFQIINPPNTLCHSYPKTVETVIINLILNSYEHAFTENGGNIKITLKPKNSDFILTYTDDGKGIPESINSKVLEPFVTTKKRNEITGLGLSLVSNLVTDKLKGHLNYESKEGEGLKFEIHIKNQI
ncbi:sensor histidine kinase [Colwellia psychrerythraea]|nr:HAMP domain-containing sensor histidine kinase [Colwellia psychrerythraea]